MVGWLEYPSECAAMATDSPEDVAGPESESGGSAARPSYGHRDRPRRSST
jgi:hypothetical protein